MAAYFEWQVEHFNLPSTVAGGEKNTLHTCEVEHTHGLKKTRNNYINTSRPFDIPDAPATDKNKNVLPIVLC